MRPTIGLLGLSVILALSFYWTTGSSKSPVVGPYLPPNAYARGVRTTLLVTATAYNCVAAQTDSSPDVTASGMRCGGNVLAVSQDLLKTLPFGTAVTVDGRHYIVGDTMHRRWTRRIDIPMVSRGEATAYGVRRVTLKVVSP